ncbi:hypothetical protein ElyMa_005911200 [Elysia marginata]|uniref:Uncharacterized protein n=1 Tax=Elysia marginata TaxID=1093978 RepID=A0AAV4G5L6_9GAST|nr:hypothetical protein ElyMa_005911200 [Elysia marginata]
MEMGWPRSKTSRQPLDPESHRMATTEQRKGITWGRDARHQERWQDSAEGYILQWMNKALWDRRKLQICSAVKFR